MPASPTLTRREALWRGGSGAADGARDVTSAEMFSIRVVTALEEFLLLANRWNALLGDTPSDSVFLTWEWQYTWAKHYLAKDQLRIILVFKNDQLVGIAPLCVTTTAAGMLKIREMRFVGSEEVGSANLDFIARKKHKRAVLQAIYGYLHGEAAGTWDLLTLSEIPSGSSSIDVWHELVDNAGRVMEVTGTTVYPVIDLRGGLEQFCASLSANERSNLQRKQRRLEALGRVTHQRICSPREVEGAMALLIRLHQSRWESRGARGVFADDRRRAFHRDIARIFAQQGWLRLDFLFLDGEAIAGIYGFTYRDRYWFYLPGLNATGAAKASPGILLLFRCIEEAVREGCVEFDLLRGAAGYKIAWAGSLRRSITLRYYNRHLRAAAIKVLESGKSTLKMLLR